MLWSRARKRYGNKRVTEGEKTLRWGETSNESGRKGKAGQVKVDMSKLEDATDLTKMG